MQQDNQQTYPYQADEIDLRKLAKSLKERRWFIFGFTGFVTLLAIVYVLLLPPPSISYIATTSFTKPSTSSFILINDKIPSVTRESIYSSFLDNIIIESLQKKVFTEGDYLSRLNKQNEPVGDVDKYISGFLNSTSLEKKGELNTFSIQGANAEILTDFLNELVIEVNNKIVNEIKNNHKQKIAFGLDEIATQVKEINDQIDGLRYKAEQDRLNQILRLTEDVKLARSLGVIENNFTQSSDTLTTASLPNWYLYGEKALLARINILKSRTSDDPFIPELVTLNNKLNEVQNNKTSRTLEEHQDDDTSYSSFFSSLNALNKKKVKLESNIIDLDSSTINAVQVIKSASVKQNPIKSTDKKLIVALALFGGFIFSIFLALLANLFKEDETEPTTKTTR